MNLTLSKKGMLVISLPFFIQLGLLLGYSALLDEVEVLADKEFHNKEVFGRTNYLSALIPSATAFSLAYALTNDPPYAQEFRKVSQQIPIEFNELAVVLANCYHSDVTDESVIDPRQGFSPSQEWWEIRSRGNNALLGYMAPGESWIDFFSGQSGHLIDRAEGARRLQMLAPLKSSWDAWTAWQQRLSRLVSHSDGLGNGAQLMSKDTRALSQSLFEGRRAILKAERESSAVSEMSTRSTRDKLRRFIAFGVAVDLAMLFGFLFLFTKGIADRLKVLDDNTRRLEKGIALNPALRGSDEIASLDRTFHGMAAALTKAKRELEASELRIRTMFNNMPVGLCVVNEEQTIEFANPTVAAIFGGGKNDYVGSSLNVLLPDVAFNWSEIVRGAQAPKPQEVVIQNLSGRAVAAEVSFKPFQIEEGMTVLVLVVIQDVTERYELERRKHEFIAMVTHDLRTPLASVQMFLQMLEKSVFGPLPEKGMRSLAKVQNSVGRLITMVHDILDFEKLEAGRHELFLARTNFSDIIDAAVDAVEEFAKKHGISVQTPEPKAHIEIVVDANRLTRVLINLLSNAVKFSPEGEVVALSVHNREDQIEVRVSDRGRGIPKTHIEAIFEKYKQVEAQDSREKGGTGLGLPICKAIVEQHGGRIGVESEVGKGSIFWFTVPKNLNETRNEP
ncbi:MAG TPA: ATP-binding protein [Candidatus Obscuribacterales bacterium]